MEDLSEQAQRAVQALKVGMTPPPADTQRAAHRLAAGIAAHERRPGLVGTVVGTVVRLLRGAATVAWRIAIPVAAMAVVVLVARALLRNEMGDAAALHNARMMLEQNRFRGAYAALAEHAREFPSPDSAKARTPLVLDALCGMGKRERASAYLERYLALVPDSDLAARRRDVCPLGTERSRRVED